MTVRRSDDSQSLSDNREKLKASVKQENITFSLNRMQLVAA